MAEDAMSAAFAEARAAAGARRSAGRRGDRARRRRRRARRQPHARRRRPDRACGDAGDPRRRAGARQSPPDRLRSLRHAGALRDVRRRDQPCAAWPALFRRAAIPRAARSSTARASSRSRPACMRREVYGGIRESGKRGAAAGVLSRAAATLSGKLIDGVVGGAVRQFAELDDQAVAKSEEIDGIEACTATSLPRSRMRRGAMHRGLVAVDQDAMHGRAEIDVVDVAVPEGFPHRLLADDLARIARMSPERLRKADDVGRKIFQHSVNIASIRFAKIA